jgi:hypothetical protein
VSEGLISRLHKNCLHCITLHLVLIVYVNAVYSNLQSFMQCDLILIPWLWSFEGSNMEELFVLSVDYIDLVVHNARNEQHKAYGL